jgi:hypothetical protein
MKWNIILIVLVSYIETIGRAIAQVVIIITIIIIIIIIIGGVGLSP